VIETPARNLGNHGLWAECDPYASGRHHRQVVGTVTDGDCLRRRDPEFGCESQEGFALDIGGNNRVLNCTRDPPLNEVEPVGDHAVKTEARPNQFGEDREPPRHQRRRGTRAPHRCDQGPRTWRQPNPCSRLLERPYLHPLEQRDASFERGNKVDLAIHRATGNFRNLRPNPKAFSELVEHLVLNDRRLQVGDEELLAPPYGRLNENIDRKALDQGARRHLGTPRVGRVEEEITGLTRGQPVGLGSDPQRRRNRPDEAWQARPSASSGHQGEDHPHKKASYSRQRSRDKPAHATGAAASVLLIAGPTASGKSALALELADAFGGTVINADSQQIYRDLRILTARPDATAEERAPHRLYGFLDAAQRGSVGGWRALALDEIATSTGAGRLPILVGGTGLYLRALKNGLAPVPKIPGAVRQEALELHRLLGGVGFREQLARLDPAGAERLFPADRQRLVRAYEVIRATGVPLSAWQRRPDPSSPYHYWTILVMPPREKLYAACDARFVRMIEADALGEAAALARRGLDPDLPAMKAVGVPALLCHLRGGMPLEAAIAAGQRATRQYAKRQMTWFRHQTVPDLTLGDQFSQDLLRSALRFVRESVLTA
jgi:tRNA dimethylallyltransferase